MRKKDSTGLSTLLVVIIHIMPNWQGFHCCGKVSNLFINLSAVKATSATIDPRIDYKVKTKDSKKSALPFVIIQNAESRYAMHPYLLLFSMPPATSTSTFTSTSISPRSALIGSP
jgi:hypothetical protein